LKFRKERVSIPLDAKKVLREHNGETACVIRATQYNRLYTLVFKHPLSEQAMSLIQPGDSLLVTGIDNQVMLNGIRTYTWIVNKFELT
jgi:hypothetical protein